MTTIKLDSKIGGGPGAALEPLVRQIYARPGCKIVGVVEFTHIERTEPAPQTEGEPSVKMRMSTLEIAGKDQEEVLREVCRTLFLQRTATGTLDEHGELELSKGTIERTAGLLADIEMARAVAALRHWGEYARRVHTQPKLTQTELRREIKALADGLSASMNRGIGA